MELDKFIGLSVDDTLRRIKDFELIVNYGKVEGTELIEAPENGYYLQANDGSGIVSEYRIYFEQNGNYFPSPADMRGPYSKLITVSDAEVFFGPAIREIRSVKIPGAKPTLPGKAFIADNVKIIIYTFDGTNITCLHRKPL